MAYPGSQTNSEFSAGVNHRVNPGRANSSSITLNDSAGTADQDDGSWERLQRDSGGYRPGSFEELSDELTDGSNNQP